MSDEQYPPRMRTDKAAEYLGLSPRTLERWRCDGTVRLPFTKIGGAVIYLRNHLDQFLEENMRHIPRRSRNRSQK